MATDPRSPIRSAAEALADDALAARLVACLDTGDMQSIDAMLLDDPAAQDALILLTLHAETIRQLNGAAAPHAAVASAEPARRDVDFRVPRAVYALAASLILAACAFAIVTLAMSNRQSPIDNRQSPPAPLASVTDVIDGTLMIDDQLADAGNDYTARSVSLDAGEAEFMLPNRVTVKLRGSTTLTIHDAMNVAMAHGTAEFDCPPGAKGYTVHLPGGAKVIDLGTAFTVDLSEDRDMVRVNEGTVRVTTPREDRVLGLGAVARIVDGRLRVREPSLVETFNGAEMPPTLERVGGDHVAFDGAVARFTGGEQERCYLRTVAADWHRRPFIAEAVVTMPAAADPWGIVFFGLGRGDAAGADRYGEPIVGPHVQMLLRPDMGVVGSHDNATTTNAVTRKAGVSLAGGTHRLRLRWDADRRIATFELDLAADGSVDARFDVDGSDNDWGDNDGRVFIGSAAGVGMLELMIYPDEDKPASPAEESPKHPVEIES